MCLVESWSQVLLAKLICPVIEKSGVHDIHYIAMQGTCQCHLVILRGILKVGDKLYFMFYCPAGFQDVGGCDIRLAIFNGELSSLAED